MKFAIVELTKNRKFGINLDIVTSFEYIENSKPVCMIYYIGSTADSYDKLENEDARIVFEFLKGAKDERHD